MIWSAQRLKQAWKLAPEVLKTTAVATLPLSISLWLMEYGVSQMHQNRFDSPHDSSIAHIIGFGLGAFVVESLVTVTWLILLAYATKRAMDKSGTSNFAFWRQHFHQVLIEYIRSLISVGFYAMLLIIPGLWRWVSLTFTCYVSLFDKNYHKGKVDALERSSEIVKGKFFPLFSLLLIFSILPMSFEKLAWSMGGGVLWVSAFYLLSWLVSVVLAVYIALTYFKLSEARA